MIFENHSDPVPLSFESPLLRVETFERSSGGKHRLEILGKLRSETRVLILHQMHQPLVTLRPDQREASLHPFPTEAHDHLVFTPLLGLVRPGIPNRHRTAAVLPLRNRARERGVLERVILGVHGQPILSGTGRHALRNSPGHEHTIPLQPNVVMQSSGVMFLNHKGIARCLLGHRSRDRLRRPVGRPLVAIVRQRVGYSRRDRRIQIAQQITIGFDALQNLVEQQMS